MDNFSANKKDFFFFWIPLSDFFSKFVFSEVYVGFLMGAHPRRNWSFFLVLYQLGWRKKMKPFVQIHFLLEMLWRLNSKVGRSWGLRPQRYFIFSPTGIFWFRHTLHFGFEHNTAIQLQAPPILIPKAQGCGFAPFQTLGHIWYLYLLSNQHTFHR